MPIAKLDDVDLYYEIHGEGTPLVMINGYSGTSDGWDDSEPVIKSLSKQYKVITLDNRGTGRSSSPKGSYNTPIMADDVVHLLEYLSVSKANILGVSMGGMIAQEVTLRHPEKVNKLVLVCTTPGGKYWNLSGQSEAGEKLGWFFNPPDGMSPSEVMDKVMELVYYPEYLARHKERIKSQVPRYPVSSETLSKQFDACMSHDTVDRLDQIKSKTLVIHGSDDLLLFAEGGRVIADKIPDSELVVYPEASHAVHVEKWSEVYPKLMKFLG